MGGCPRGRAGGPEAGRDEPAGAARTDAPVVVRLTIDGRAVEASPGELLIDAAERAGIFIPRFCYHPRMAPVGMCRMCLVEVSGPRGFALQPACVLAIAEGQEVRTASAKARKAQQGVLEFLLINHPLDCPVCDKGGECPLQDQALSHGPGESRFVEEKRHWAKPIEIGPLVLLDRERCIQCARCTRFAAEVAGEPLIDLAFRHRRRRGVDVPRQALRFVLRRQHHPDLSRRRAHGSRLPLQVAPMGPRAGRDDVHDVRRRLPRRRAVVGGAARALPRRRLRSGEPELAVRQGPLRLRGGPFAEPSRHPGGGAPGRPGPRDLARGARRRGRGDPSFPRTRRTGIRRGPRRGEVLERGRLRLGQARQGGPRHGFGRRAARRRASRRRGARPAARDDRRDGAGQSRRHAVGRPARGTPRPLPAPAAGRARRRADRRVLDRRDGAQPARPPPACLPPGRDRPSRRGARRLGPGRSPDRGRPGGARGRARRARLARRRGRRACRPLRPAVARRVRGDRRRGGRRDPAGVAESPLPADAAPGERARRARHGSRPGPSAGPGDARGRSA